MGNALGCFDEASQHVLLRQTLRYGYWQCISDLGFKPDLQMISAMLSHE